MWRSVFCLAGLVALMSTTSGCDEDAECDGCVIGGDCYADQDPNPANPCEVCDVDADEGAWTNNDGASCDDGLYCNGDDTCLAGDCSEHGSDPCYGMGLCDEDADNCEGECDGCIIGSTCYADGDTNPDEVCEVCEVASATAMWTNNDGVSCDDDRFCNGADTCGGGSCSVHVGDPCTPPEMCNETADECDASCSGCVIGVICFGDNTPNPENVCEICDVSASVTGWTDNDGVSCQDGDFCTGIDTCNAGVCEHTGDPCDVTETCDATSATCVPSYGTCIAPILVTGDATFFGTSFTTVFGDDLNLQDATCDGGNGFPQSGSSEAVFQLDLGPGDSVNIREDGALDAVIMIIPTCDATSTCSLVDDNTEDANYTASASEIVHVVVSAMDASPTNTDYQIVFHFP